MDYIFVLGRSIVCGPALFVSLFAKSSYEKKLEKLICGEDVHFGDIEQDFRCFQNVHFELFRVHPIRYLYNFYNPYVLSLYAAASTYCGILLFKRFPQTYILAQICQLTFLYARHN